MAADELSREDILERVRAAERRRRDAEMAAMIANKLLDLELALANSHGVSVRELGRCLGGWGHGTVHNRITRGHDAHEHDPAIVGLWREQTWKAEAPSADG